MTTTPYSHGYLRLGGKPLPPMNSALYAPKSEPIQVRADPGSHPDMELGAPVSHVGMSRDQARGSGFTGDQCDNCNSMRMKVSGHCTVCEDCGTTTGCS
jgi:hypothetical protein